MAGRPSPGTAHARSRVSSGIRDHGRDDPGVILAQRDLQFEKLADHVRKVVALAPPITAEQRCKLALLLVGGGARDELRDAHARETADAVRDMLLAGTG